MSVWRSSGAYGGAYAAPAALPAPLRRSLLPPSAPTTPHLRHPHPRSWQSHTYTYAHPEQRAIFRSLGFVVS